MRSTDHQLLFGVLALQMDFLSPEQFAEACTVWASHKAKPLPEILAERGWLQPEDVGVIEKLLARRVARHAGDVSATLREAGVDPRVHHSMATVLDFDLRQSIAPEGPKTISLLGTRLHEPDTLDHYTLSHVHAEGGIGLVWLAYDNTLRREVALKELRPERVDRPMLQARFLREAQITGQLAHPSIVPIYELGSRPDAKSPYYTMRFVRGRTFDQAAADYHRRRQRGEATPLDLRRLLGAFVAVCNAVAYAHSRGVLHRDLKPQNVILGDFGEVMLLDWGLARMLGSADPGPLPMDLEPSDEADATRAGQVVGTPAYMPPEQAEGRHDLACHASDVYGLGAILYHLLTNEPPFMGKSADEILRKVIEDPVRPAAELVAETPPALDAICLKALAKKPGDRYQSASALSDEVQRWLADEPVSAYPDPYYVRAGRWMRRHRPFVAAASVFLVCSTLALGAIAALTWRQQQETARHRQRTADFAAQLVTAADAAYGSAEQVRGSIAQAGVGQVRALLQDRPDDPPLNQALALLLQFDATAKRVSGRYQQALASQTEAVAIADRIVASSQENTAFRALAAMSYFNLGFIQSMLGKRTEAAASHERSFQLHGQAPRYDLVARRNQAIAANELSAVHFGWKSMEAVEAESRAAADLLDEIAADVPPNQAIVLRLLQIGALNRAAECHCALGRAADALSLLEKAEELFDRELADESANNDVRHFRANCWLCRASASTLADRGPAALGAYQKAIELWTQLLKESTNRDAYRLMLVHALTSRADLHRRQHRNQDAEADLRLAEKTLLASPKEYQGTIAFREYRARLAEARTRLAIDAKDAAAVNKQLSDARDAFNSWIEVDPLNQLAKDALSTLEKDAKNQK